LIGGASPYEGEVNIFLNGQWGKICSDEISANEADTLCKSLGFGPHKFVFNSTLTADIPVIVDSLDCSEHSQSPDHFSMCKINEGSENCTDGGGYLGLSCSCKAIIHVCMWLYVYAG